MRSFSGEPAADEGLRLTTKFGPSIAGLIAAFRVGRMVGVRDITRRLLTVRVRIAWFALCLFLPVIISMGSLAIRSIFGSDVWNCTSRSWPHGSLPEVAWARSWAGGDSCYRTFRLELAPSMPAS